MFQIRRQTEVNTSIINLSNTSMLSQGESTQRSHQPKKKIVLSSNRLSDRSSKKQNTTDNNKENRSNNTLPSNSIQFKHPQLLIHPSQFQYTANTLLVTERNLQSQSHFYMESSVDQPILPRKQSKKKGDALRCLATKYYRISHNIKIGCQIIRRLFLKEPFDNLKQNYHSLMSPTSNEHHRVSQHDVLALDRNLKRMGRILLIWIGRVSFGNIRRHAVETSHSQIQMAVDLIKKRDYQLSCSSKTLSIRILSFILSQHKARLHKHFIRLLKTRQPNQPLQHKKLYSFSNSFN